MENQNIQTEQLQLNSTTRDGNIRSVAEIMKSVQNKFDQKSEVIFDGYICFRCKEKYTIEKRERDTPRHWEGKELCGKCKFEDEMKLRTARWTAICPPLYQNTDRLKLPDEEARKSYDKIQLHKFQGRGLVVHGLTRRGKTRAIWDRIKIGYMKTGTTPKYCLGSMFSVLISESFEEHQTSKILKDFSETPLLFFDDIGQMIFTERVQECLFTILELRCAYLRPTIFTMNDIGQTLKDKFSGNRGDAFVGRLKEFCEIIKF